MIFNIVLHDLSSDDIVDCVDAVGTTEASCCRTRPNVSAGCDDICTFTIVENDGHP